MTVRIIAFADDAAPTGWLLCDGTSYLRADYPEIFAAIGTTYGAVDGTHFSVPDLRSRMAIGKATSGTASALSQSGGALGHQHAHSHDHGVTQPSTHTAHVVTQPGAHSALTHAGFDATDHSSATHTGGAVAAHSVTESASHGTHNAAGTHDHDSHSSGTNVTTGGSASGITAPTGQHADDGSHDHNAHTAHNEAVSAHSVTQPSAHGTQAHTPTQPSSHGSPTHTGMAASAHAAHSGAAAGSTAVTFGAADPPYLVLTYIIGTGVLPVGAVLEWAGSDGAVPAGHLLCDGQAVSRATYDDLFAVTGTTYGVGNGSTTFNVPDMRGRHPLGKGGALAQGDTGGSASHTHAGASHGHSVTQPNAHADHTVTQASDHDLTHTGGALAAHAMAHSGFSVGGHSVTQSSGHGTHNSEGAHNHDAHTIATDLATVDADVTVLTGPSSMTTEGGHTHDAHSAHSGAALSAHAETQPSDHNAAHSVTQAAQHDLPHSGADLDSHSAHAGAAVTAASSAATDAGTAPFVTFHYIVKADAGTQPVGALYAVGEAAAPSGSLLCDGSAVSRTTYADLFAAIGTTYGAGNGTTTFNLPDLRGRIPRGASGDMGTSGGSRDHTHAISTGHGHSATQPSAHSAHAATQASGHGTVTHSGMAATTHSLSHSGMSVSNHSVTQANSHSAHDASASTNHDPHTTGARTGGTNRSVRTGPVTHSFDGSHTHTGAHTHSGFAVSAHSETQPSAHSLSHSITQPSSHSPSAHSGWGVDAHSAHAGFAVSTGGTGTTDAANPPYLVVNWVVQSGVEVYTRDVSGVTFDAVASFVVTTHEVTLNDVPTTPPSSPIIYVLEP